MASLVTAILMTLFVAQSLTSLAVQLNLDFRIQYTVNMQQFENDI